MNISELNMSGCLKRKQANDINPSSAKSQRVCSSFYITLAKESPRRNLESEEETYASYHEYETEVCRDSSDTDSECSTSSGRTEAIATMEVLEYEVASTSHYDDSSSSDSSSGTDDFVLAAFAHALCEAESTSSEFTILADTEESDEHTRDSEISPADYWECVKCRNKQNNPMYRYCERCYQVRKSLFPPRPKQRKRRTIKKTKKRLSSESDSSLSSSDEEIEVQGGTKTNGKSFSKIIISDKLREKGRVSLGESTIKKESSIDIEGMNRNKAANGKKQRHRKRRSQMGMNGGPSTPKTAEHSTKLDLIKKDSKNYPITQASSLSSINSSVKRKNEEQHGETSKCMKSSLENKIFKNVLQSEGHTESDSDCSKPKDSGISSGSSQESQEIIPSFEEQSSQETCSSEIENNKIACSMLEANYPSDNYESISQGLEKQGSSLSQASTVASSMSTDTGTSFYNNADESDSGNEECIGTNSQMSPADENAGKLVSTESNLGFCMFCLVEPKNGVFVHNNFLHLCCCYKCAVKVWKQRKSCPICNCKVKNVMKLFAH